MRAFPIVLIGALAISAPQVSGAEQPASPALTLTGAVREALLANPELVALRRDYDAAQAAVPAARFLDAPMFETQIWSWPVTTVNPAMVDMYMFTAEQGLPGRGKRAAREFVAGREAEMSRRQIAVRANDILNDVKQTVRRAIARARHGRAV